MDAQIEACDGDRFTFLAGCSIVGGVKTMEKPSKLRLSKNQDTLLTWRREVRITLTIDSISTPNLDRQATLVKGQFEPVEQENNRP
ncbi:MAG: hypothetical protein AAF539_10555 [Planctomycetota bacterium]